MVHLVRNCKYLVEAEKSEWAKGLKATLQKAMHLRKSKGEEFNPLETETLSEITKIHEEITELFNKAPPEKEEKTLFNGLIGRLKQILLFLEDPAVPYHNNSSEQALRNRVVNRKVTGGFRTEKGSHRFDVAHSILETAKCQGKNILDALMGKISLVSIS